MEDKGIYCIYLSIYQFYVHIVAIALPE